MTNESVVKEFRRAAALVVTKEPSVEHQKRRAKEHITHRYC